MRTKIILLLILVSFGYSKESVSELNNFAITKQKARAKDPEAQFLLFTYYYNGKFVKKNRVRAMTWLKRAARNGHLDAKIQLMQSYLSGIVVTKDEKKGFAIAKELADSNNIFGDYLVGDMQIRGVGTPKDVNKGFLRIEKAAKKGVPVAFRYLAWCYLTGTGTKKSYEKSLAWITIASRAIDTKDIKDFRNAVVRSMKPGQIAYAQKYLEEIVSEFQNEHKEEISESKEEINEFQTQQMKTLREQKMGLLVFVFVREGIGKGPSKIHINLDEFGKEKELLELPRVNTEFLRQEAFNTMMAVPMGNGMSTYVNRTDHRDHYVSYYVASAPVAVGDYSFIGKVGKRRHKFDKMKIRRGKAYILAHDWSHEKGFSNTNVESEYLDKELVIYAKQLGEYLADKSLLKKVASESKVQKLSVGPHEVTFHLDFDYKEKTKAETLPVVVIDKASLIQSDNKKKSFLGTSSLIKTKTFGARKIKTYTHTYIDTSFKADFSKIKVPQCFNLKLVGHVNMRGDKRGLGKSGEVFVKDALCLKKGQDLKNIKDITLDIDRNGTRWDAKIK